MKSAIAFLVISSALTMISSESRAQLMCEPTRNPAEVKFVYDDLKNFIYAMELLENSTDSVAIIREQYIDKASAGLGEFIRENDVKAVDYVDLIRKKPGHYESLQGMPEFLEAQEENIRINLSKLQSKIPGATFLPVYYLVGFYSGLHAEPSPYGLLLAFGNPGRHPKNLSNTVVHETVHVQQALTVGLEEYQSIYGPKRSLLALAIREGVARFLTELITGHNSNQEAYEYYLQHESELITRFQREMNDSSAGDWMWAKPKNPEQPQQIGYVLGSLIVRAFYEKAADKNQAIGEILSVTDYDAFLGESNFGQ
jgi:hypothetical protein